MVPWNAPKEHMWVVIKWQDRKILEELRKKIWNYIQWSNPEDGAWVGLWPVGGQEPAALW